jgi:dolichol-phosphate mannosyltransferase
MACLSIVIPVFNEAKTLPLLREHLMAVADRLDVEVDIVLVDDHSRDETPQMIRQWQSKDPRVTYVRLSRNCGSHAAVAAGLKHCIGDCAVLLAADLQDPPEIIPNLLIPWRGGYHVVWANRAEREGESWRTKVLAGLYYRLMRRIALPEMSAAGSDVVLLDRKVIDAWTQIPEKNTSLMAMILWMGFQQTSIEYVKQARHAGDSKWTLSKRIKLAVDSVVSFSYVPIRFMSCAGLVMAACGFFYAVVVLLGRLFGWVVAGTGYAALMTVLLVGQGMILSMLGVLGEYLWRTYDEARGRPRYIIEEYVTSNRPSSPSQAKDNPS